MPNSASWIGPTIRITTSIDPRIALNRVKMLARAISASVRLVRSSATLTWPRATRSATSAAVSPFGPGGLAGVGRRGQLGRGRGHLENANRADERRPARGAAAARRAQRGSPINVTKRRPLDQLWGAGSRSGG